MSEYVENNVCIVKHKALDKELKHMGEHGQELKKKYDLGVRLLIGALGCIIVNLAGVIALLIKLYVL
jgi:hypothetical protein